MESDAVLLTRWRAGDRQAGEEIFRRHFQTIYRFFQGKAGSEADDLVQATFMASLRSRAPFNGDGTIKWYLLGIARHELYRFFGRLKKESIDFGVTSLADFATTAATRLARAQQIGHLQAALERLPLDQQLLLEQHYWEEMDAAALAVMFEAKPGAIRVRLLRARRALKLELAAVEAEAGTTHDGNDPLSRALQQPEPPNGTDEDE
jgi:RNA polymerase sigma factor (sigma-70 family)